MVRLFIAIDLPESLKIHLANLRDDALPGRWTSPTQYHVTVRFLGKIEQDGIASLTNTLANIRTEALLLQGHGLGVFPSMRKPRVLFAAIDPTPALLELRTKVDQALRSFGFAADPKPFHPHVTLARLRQANVQTLHAYLRAHKSFMLAPFKVNHFYLYESLLRPEGALYTRRATFTLHTAR